ncbi:MAG: alpha/beta hydrolase family protein [Candidatus Neomarinimicrobiota bacterium]
MMRSVQLIAYLLPLLLIFSCSLQFSTEELAFQSGRFRVVGDLRLPPGPGPHPVVVFVHGDGPNNRTSGVTYPPIMDRMLAVGYAAFAWDKPGTGESSGKIDRSRLLEQRAQIVLDAVEFLKERPDIDTQRIGLWGISQAGYVMPRVLERSEDIAFMIAVSCPGEPGAEQGAYLFAAQALCAGASEEEATQIEYLLAEIERADDYETYVRYKEQLAGYPFLEGLGLNLLVATEEQWHHPNFEGDYFWDPMTVIERTTIPVLAFFGGKDTQADPIQGARAYRAALERAGNPHYRVELIPRVDHNLIISETGSLREREQRSRRGWQNYAPVYLDILEEWLRELHEQTP